MKKMTDFIQTKGKCLKETERAVLIYFESIDDTLWVPKSLLSEDSEVQGEDDGGVVEIARWFAEKEGIE